MNGSSLLRARWAAFGAAVAVTLGLASVGAVSFVGATISNGEKAVFVPLTPTRILDTRNGTGGITGPIVAGGTFELQVTGVAGVPGDATSVVLNVTGTQVTAATFVTVWPAGLPLPEASNLNLSTGQDAPNLVTVKLGAGGRLAFRNQAGNVQLIADIAGYYVDHNHDDRYYTKADIDALITTLLSKAEADATYVPKEELGSVSGILRWARIRDLGATVEVYIDDESRVFPTMSVVRTATGVYEVTVPGVTANGAYHGILVSAEQGQTTVFRACKVFQTVSANDPADTLVVRVRCYDQNAALQNTDFHILVLQ